MNMRTADRLPPTPSLTPSPSPGHPLPQRHSSHTHRRNLSRPFHEAIDVPPQTDPLKVLRKIIGKRDDKRRPSSHPPPASPVKGPDSKATGAEKPPILIESIDFGSLSLEEFANQAEGEEEKHRLSQSVDGQPQTQTQSQSIESCIALPLDISSLYIGFTRRMNRLLTQFTIMYRQRPAPTFSGSP